MNIDKNTIIKDLIEAHPETIAVFRKHKLVIAGGVRGPNEPIAFFAKAHDVEYDALAAELKEAVENHSGEKVEAPLFQVDTVYEKFVKTAILLTLTAGVTSGAAVLSYIAFKSGFGSFYYRLIQAHGHEMLLGWAGLAIMGFAMYIIPRLKSTELRHKNLTGLSFWLMVAGILIRLLQPFTAGGALKVLMPVSSSLELVSIVLFSTMMFGTMKSSTEPRAVFDKFFVAGIIWFLMSAAVDLGMTAYAYLYSLAEIPKAIFSPYVHLFLFGFVFMFIFGVNTRTVYAFLDVKTVREKAVNLGFWLLTLSLPLYFLANTAADSWPIALSLTQFIVFPIALGIFTFIYGLRVFERSTGELSGVKMDRSYTKTIRTAYLWLILGTVLLVVLPFLGHGSELQKRFHGSLNHALTVGFLTMMIIGYASKMVPTFKGVEMFSKTLSETSFILINIGCSFRVFSQMLVEIAGGNKLVFGMLGASGWIEFTALAVFGYNIWKTMNIVEETKQAAAAEVFKITKASKVFDIVDRYPETLQVFLDFGFAQLANPAMLKTMGKVATIDMATKMHNVDPEKFLNSLNEKIAAK